MKCPKCDSENTLCRDDDRIYNIPSVKCVKCGYRYYEVLELKYCKGSIGTYTRTKKARLPRVEGVSLPVCHLEAGNGFSI